MGHVGFSALPQGYSDLLQPAVHSSGVLWSLCRCSRPAHQSDALSLESAAPTASSARSANPGTETGPDAQSSLTVLPTCGADGVISLNQGVTYRTDVSNHSIPETCHMLRGAPGSRIVLYGSITFSNTRTVIIRGPLHLTMAPGIGRLSSPAIRSAGDLRVVTPSDSTLEFRDIATSDWGAALSASRSVMLEGKGRMSFRNISSRGASVAHSEFFDVTSTVPRSRSTMLSKKRGQEPSTRAGRFTFTAMARCVSRIARACDEGLPSQVLVT